MVQSHQGVWHECRVTMEGVVAGTEHKFRVDPDGLNILGWNLAQLK